MKKRIADIVTEFSVEGLAKVQRALKKLGQDVRDSGAKSERLDKNTETTAANADRAAVSMGKVSDNADKASDSTGDLSKNLDGSHHAASRTADALQDVDTSADDAARSVDRSGDSMDDLARNARNASVEVENVRRDVDHVAPAADDAAEAVDDMADAAERAAPHVADVDRHLDSSAVSSRRVSDALRDVGDRAQDVRRDTDRVDDALGDAARSAARTEHALGDVGRSAGAAADDIDRIRDTTRDVGRDAGRVADEIEDVGRAARTAAGEARDIERALVDADRPTSGLTRGIDRIRTAMQGLVERLRIAGRSIRTSLGAAPAAVVAAFDRARSYVTSSLSALGGRVQVFSGMVGQALGEVGTRTVALFRTVRSSVVGALSSLSVLAGQSATKIGAALVAGIVASKTALQSAFSSALVGALAGLSGLGALGGSALGSLLAGARAAGTAIKSGLASSIAAVGASLTTLGGATNAVFGKLVRQVRRAYRFVKSQLSTLTAQVGNVAGSIATSVLAVPGLLSTALTSSMTAIGGAATALVSGIGTALVGAFAAAQSAIQAGMGVIGSLVASAGTTAGAVLSGIGTAVGATFAAAGAVLTTAISGVISGISSIGALAVSAFGGVAALMTTFGSSMGAAFVAGGQMAVNALAALSGFAPAAMTGVVAAFRAVGRAFRLLGRGGIAALRSIGSAAASVARGIVSAFATVGSAITKALTSKAGLLTGAGVGLGNLAVKGAKAFSPLLGLAGGAAGVLATAISMPDVKDVRNLSEALGLPPEVVSQWQYMASQVGVSSETVMKAMQTLGTAMTGVAAGDEDAKMIAADFEKVGIEVADVTGRFKTVSALMSEIAKKSRFWSHEQRNHIFERVFGDADAVEMAGLFRDVGKDYDRLNGQMQSNKDRGFLITPEQIAAFEAFQKTWSEFMFTMKVFLRDLAIAFQPIFANFLKFAGLKLELPGQREAFAQNVFVKPFERAWKLTTDIMQAWWGFDFDEWFTGKSSGGVSEENKWLYDVKKGAQDVWSVLTGLVQLVYGITEAFVSLFRAVDEVVMLLTGGFSMEGWLVGDGASDFEAFAWDARKILATLFGEPVDMSQLTTSFGKSLASGIESIKGVIAPIWQAIVRDMIVGWGEFVMSLEDDRPLAAFYSWTGAALKILDDFQVDVVAFGKALWDVVVEGRPAPEEFAWLDDLKTIFEGIGHAVNAVAEAMKLLTPAYDVLDGISEAFLGISGATTLLLGAGLAKLGILLGGLAAPLGVALVPLLPYAAAIGAVVGGIYLLYKLLTDFTGTIERIVQGIEWAWNKLGFGGGPQPSDDLTSDEGKGPKRIDYMLRRSDLDIERQGIEARIERTDDAAELKALQAEMAKNSAALAKVAAELEAFDAAADGKVAPAPETDPATMSTLGQTAARDLIAAQMREAQAARTQATNALAAQAAQAPEIRAASAEVQAANATTTAGTATTNAQSATVQTGEARVDAASVQLVTNGSTVTLDFGEGETATGVFQPDQADALRRAHANRIGGNR